MLQTLHMCNCSFPQVWHTNQAIWNLTILQDQPLSLSFKAATSQQNIDYKHKWRNQPQFESRSITLAPFCPISRGRTTFAHPSPNWHPDEHHMSMLQSKAFRAIYHRLMAVGHCLISLRESFQSFINVGGIRIGSSSQCSLGPAGPHSASTHPHCWGPGSTSQLASVRLGWQQSWRNGKHD